MSTSQLMLKRMGQSLVPTHLSFRLYTCLRWARFRPTISRKSIVNCPNLAHLNQSTSGQSLNLIDYTRRDDPGAV